MKRLRGIAIVPHLIILRLNSVCHLGRAFAASWTISTAVKGLLAIVVCSAWAAISPVFADQPQQRSAVIHLTNGDFAAGTLVQSSDDCLGWQSPAFASPFQFSLGGVASIHFPAPAESLSAQGRFVFELAGGDLLFGDLIGLDSEVASLEIPGIGRLTVDRSVIQHIARREGGNEQLFVGPSGLNGWKTSGDPHLWREDGGHLIADKPRANLSRDFGLPDQCRIEMELSWTTNPDFEVAIGVGDDLKSASRAFRFEVLDHLIVVQRETEREADVAKVQDIGGKSGRLHVQAFIDQKLGKILVFSSNGAPLAELNIATSKPTTLGGIQFTNRGGGDLRLERLQIGRWNGESPRNVELDKSRIHRGDGTIIYGTLQSLDSDTHEFIIGDESNSQRIAEDAVQDLFLAQSTEIAPRGLRAVYLTGMKISGDLVRVEDQRAWLKAPGIQQLIPMPLDSLQSVIVLKPKVEPAELPQRKGRLEIQGATLHGCLIDSAGDGASCLVWQSARSTVASPLQQGISARIIYRDPPPPVQSNPAHPHVQLAIPQRIVRAASPRKPSKKAAAVLHLRTGDMISCDFVSIDEKDGLTFKSAVSEGTFIPHSQIQVLELVPDASPVQISKVKKDRLLTLPRMQRDNPPTHLFRSVDGDYLRGRLVSLDETQAKVELRLEGKIVRRDRIARIIWLHPENLGPSAKAAAGANPRLVQALISDGNRVTFLPEKVTGSILSGQTELLGVCHVDLLHVDQLLLGSAVDQATAELAFHQWKLKPATDPSTPKEGAEGSGDGGEGQESALIGKPAPEIQLKNLDGEQFRLSDHKGKIVVLDFWASWCGPCLQAMPQIDKVTHEFADQGIELFAVNLEETPDKIKAALERLKLSPTVLLDREGRVAEKYGATSIPQTVIINREGVVSRLFVGGGARFDEQLRGAIKAVLTGDAAKSE